MGAEILLRADGFDDLFREVQLVVEPVTESQAQIAREAYRDFGKGSGHPAGLKFGDCFAYALAKAMGFAAKPMKAAIGVWHSSAARPSETLSSR